MIAHLSGTLIFSNDRFVIIETAGVGYKVRTTISALQALLKKEDKRVSLWIHTAVREDALDLYGFENEAELEFFELLISVSGIGPKGALGILNVAPASHLREAIAMGDTGALTKVSGIGPKSAQKIILELRDKLGGGALDSTTTTLGAERDVIEGLVALGFTERQAREALKEISAEIKGTSARIKEALKLLGR